MSKYCQVKEIKICICVAGEKKFECDICGKKFIHSYTLTAHRRIHTGEKPFVCSICGHSCTTSTQLTLHTRTHTQERPYICSLCPKVYECDAYCLLKHNRLFFIRHL